MKADIVFKALKKELDIYGNEINKIFLEADSTTEQHTEINAVSHFFTKRNVQLFLEGELMQGLFKGRWSWLWFNQFINLLITRKETL